MLDIALSTVVTAGFLEEFRFLKFSFELFHHLDYHWFIRCDQASETTLSKYANVTCSVFTECQRSRPDMKSEAFRDITGEKMSAVADAWAAANWDAIAYLDADLVFTAPTMEQLLSTAGEIVLTPHYYPATAEHLAASHGYYNSGFVFMRDKRFCKWWRDAFDLRRLSYSDQECLNDVGQHFTVGTLGESANIGFWRSADIPNYPSIPASCLFLHVHLFQPLRTARDWVDKSFAVHCINFLRTSRVPEHRVLFNEILARDRSGWYAASLKLS